MYKAGERITIIDRNKSGVITSSVVKGKITYYTIMLDSGSTTSAKENEIRGEIINPDPFQLLEQANFQPKSIYIITSIINKRFGNSNDVIATLKSSKTGFLPYQFKPLLKFIRSENRRILIADEVGLGKTIEAGYILTELSLRKQINNCLIICPATLKEKWRTELKRKFGFNFKIYTRKELHEAIIDDVENENKSVLAIISYGFQEEKSEAFLKLLESNSYSFDMLIIDEAHSLRNLSTIKHRAARRLVDIANNTVLLTATPMMTSEANLYSLVKLIEPNYDEYYYANQDYGFSLFMDHLALTRPFIEALNQLNNGLDPKQLVEELLEKKIPLKISLTDGTYSFLNLVSVKERFKDDPLLNSLIDLSNKENLSYSDYALLQKMLSELNSFNDVLSRTRKKEVQTDVHTTTRKAEKCAIDFTPTEKALYNSIIADFDGEPLALVLRKRQATSCLPAYIKKHKVSPDIATEIEQSDSKFERFYKIIKKVVIDKKKKIIVFSFFKDTLRYLEARLSGTHVKSFRIDGDIPVDERHPIIETFKNSTDTNVLLLSEVGNTGIDLQFCDALVNYDLPWNPMIVEQRIGRIDRIGQKSPVIHIYNLCISGTIEDQIFDRLMNRIKIFTEAIGGLDDILTSESKLFEQADSLENEIYGHRLTDEAIEKKIRDREIALESAIIMQKQIEANTKDSLLSEKYIDDEIRSISKQKKYITHEDIKEILKLLFRTRLATLRCDLDSSNPYIRWEQGDTSLFDFINENLSNKDKSPIVHKSCVEFRKKCLNSNKVFITFDQQTAAEHMDIEFISATHPLAQAAMNYFNSQSIVKNNAFFFNISPTNAPKEFLTELIYILVKFNIQSLKYISTKEDPETSSFELQLLFSMNDAGEIVLLEDDQLTKLLEIDFNFWESNPNYIPTKEICVELVNSIKPHVLASFHEKRSKIQQELADVHVSKQSRVLETEIDFLRRQIKRNQDVLDRHPDNKIKSILLDRNTQHALKIADLIKQIGNIRHQLEDTLQSISIIQLI